jgi:alkyl hydroperoxide reductase subunit AhpC
VRTQGIIRTFSINDEPVGRSIDETFRQLEVCDIPKPIARAHERIPFLSSFTDRK